MTKKSIDKQIDDVLSADANSSKVIPADKLSKIAGGFHRISASAGGDISDESGRKDNGQWIKEQWSKAI